MKKNIQNESKIYFQSDIIGDYYCVSQFGKPEISTSHSLSYDWSNSVFIGIPPEIKVEDKSANKFQCRQNVTFSNGIDIIRFTIHRHDRNTGKTFVLYKGDFGQVTDQMTDEQDFLTQTFSERFFSSNSEVCMYNTSQKYNLLAVFRAGGTVLKLIGTKNKLHLENMFPIIRFSVMKEENISYVVFLFQIMYKVEEQEDCLIKRYLDSTMSCLLFDQTILGFIYFKVYLQKYFYNYSCLIFETKPNPRLMFHQACYFSYEKEVSK